MSTDWQCLIETLIVNTMRVSIRLYQSVVSTKMCNLVTLPEVLVRPLAPDIADADIFLNDEVLVSLDTVDLG